MVQVARPPSPAECSVQPMPPPTAAPCGKLSSRLLPFSSTTAPTLSDVGLSENCWCVLASVCRGCRTLVRSTSVQPSTDKKSNWFFSDLRWFIFRPSCGKSCWKYLVVEKELWKKLNKWHQDRGCSMYIWRYCSREGLKAKRWPTFEWWHNGKTR